MNSSAPVSPAKPRRFPTLIYVAVFTLICVFASAPILSVLIVSSIASAHGCLVDEGSVHPCVINGVDRGETLNTFAVLGWFALFTIPIGAIAFFACLVLFIIHLVIWLQKRRANVPVS